MDYQIENGILVKYTGNGGDVVIPEGVMQIKDASRFFRDGVFENCLSLTSIKLPKSLNDIGNRSFYGCKNLTSVVIPNGVKRIGESAFYDCKKLDNITISDSLTYIGNDAFATDFDDEDFDLLDDDNLDIDF